MIEKEKLKQTIFGLLDEVNQQLPSEQKLKKSMDTTLLGSTGQLDSLSIVNLIVATEQKIEEEYSITISLADDESMFQEDGPLGTVGTFYEHVYALIGKSSHGQETL